MDPRLRRRRRLELVVGLPRGCLGGDHRGVGAIRVVGGLVRIVELVLCELRQPLTVRAVLAAQHQDDVGFL
jgi:hypothetical protein